MRDQATSRRALLTACGLALAPTVAPAAPATSTPAKAAPMKDIRYVVFHSPGPQWLPGRSMFEQPGLDLHVAHYRQWLVQGKLMAGGPHLDAAGGGMMVPEPGLGEEEVTAFALADPAVKAGLLTVQVRPWLLGMKR
jgi:uncharacterized protein YciI